MKCAISNMFKLIVLVISLKIIAISCDKSFTVVLDTTVSMNDEINVIKANIGQVVNSINSTDIQNYILVPFKDIFVETPFITESRRYFTSHLNTITTSGGRDCPENSLAGIEAALRASEKESFIFVFTDAYAKDYHKLQTIESLCRESHSQVFIFLSGFCLPSQASAVNNVDVYYDVSKACSGAFFNFNTTYDLRQAFNFMKEVINTEWTDISPQEMFANHKELSFTVDTITTDFMISVSGSNPTLSILETASNRPRTVNRVLFTRHALVVHLKQPDAGQYSVSIRGQGKVFVTYYERNYIPFQYGFSTKIPRSLIETSLRPLSGVTNYVMISVDTAIHLEYIELLNAGESAKQVLYLEEKRPGLYVSSQHFVEPGKNFRIWIIGEDAVTRQNIRGSTKFIFPQVSVANMSSIKPDAEILDTELNLVDFATAVTLACKVTGFPKPDIHWEDASGVLPSEVILLEIPSVYISYVTLSNVTANSTVYCKSINAIGDASESKDIYVNRTFSFDVKQTPEDTTVEYGDDLKLFCEVIAYPEATIEWYLNKTKINTYSNQNFNIEDNSFIVKSVGIDDGGIYECVVSNGVVSETFSATVTISGLEAPEIKIKETEITVKPGDWVDIECSTTKGKPAPELIWQYKKDDAYDYDDVSKISGVTLDDGKLTISSAGMQHSGLYRCLASNILGQDSKDVSLKIQYPPRIKNNELETATVKEGDSVQLVCDVEAFPIAVVRWEMSQDDITVILDEKHETDENHTLHFTALWHDSGNYHCVAENTVGKAKRTVTVNVLVPPYIEPPKSETINSISGGHVRLACNVLYGTPAPSIKWEYIAVDSTSNIVALNNSTLRLENVTKSNEGSYMCIAENEIGIDRIKYSLKIQ